MSALKDWLEGKALPPWVERMEQCIDKDFQLTADDIATGVIESAEQYPIALALRRFLGSDFSIAAHTGHVELRMELPRYGVYNICPYLYSDGLRAWAERYDNGERVEPLTLRFSRRNRKPNHPVLRIAGC